MQSKPKSTNPQKPPNSRPTGLPLRTPPIQDPKTAYNDSEPIIPQPAPKIPLSLPNQLFKPPKATQQIPHQVLPAADNLSSALKNDSDCRHMQINKIPIPKPSKPQPNRPRPPQINETNHKPKLLLRSKQNVGEPKTNNDPSHAPYPDSAEVHKKPVSRPTIANAGQ